MTVHLEREIAAIKRQVLSLSALVEEQVCMAVESLLRRDGELACVVRERDERIDQLKSHKQQIIKLEAQAEKAGVKEDLVQILQE